MVMLGRADEAFGPIERALRLDPRERGRFIWEYYACSAHAHLAQWDQAIEWCEKSIASNPTFPWSHADLAAAYGWLGRSAEAKSAVAELRKLMPDFDARQYVMWQASDNAKWKTETDRIVEGLRKAGLPES